MSRRQSPDDMQDEEPSQDRIDQLIERVNQLETFLRQNAARLYAIEKRLDMAHQFLPPLQVAPETKRETAAPPGQSPADRKPFSLDDMQTQNAEPERNKSASTLLPHLPPRPVPSTQARVAQKPRGDLESRIGGNWFNRIGMFAIALGVGFFLKYAFDNQWIGPWGRVMIGISIGLGFLIAGERLRPRYHTYAYGLTGGGILILYLSFYAAYRFLGLIEPLPAFICMAVVTATASLLSARYNALPIAVLGLIGGFLTPVLLSTGQDNEAGLFGYIALLDLGVLALAYSKQWRGLNYMAFTATVFMFALWCFSWYAPEKLWPTVIFLTLFFSIFALLAVLYNVVNRRPTGWADLALVFLNALLYFGASYALLEARYDAYLGLFAAMVSVFYLLLGYFTYERDREDRLLLYTFLGLAILFAVLTVPIQFNQHWVTMGWAIEGAILTWVGLRVGDKTSRYASLLVFMIAALHWIAFDIGPFGHLPTHPLMPLANRRSLSCAVLIAALSLASWFYKRHGEKVEQKERAMFGGIFVLGANALAVTMLSFEANDYFEHKMARGQDSPDLEMLNNTRHLTLTTLWATYGAAALFIGVARNLKALRVAALVLLIIATFKALAMDLSYYDAAWHTFIFNPTFAAFLAIICALAASAWFYSHAKDVDEGERAAIIPALIVAANALAVVALSAEASGYFKARIFESGGLSDDARNLRLAQQLSLSVTWTVYGGALLILGIARRSRLLRLMALLLLGLTILKVFLIDLSSLEKFYRIISFIVLGAILLTVSFLYQRIRQRAAEAEADADGEAKAGTD